MISFSDIGTRLPGWLALRFNDLTKWRGIDWKRAGTSDKMAESDGRSPAASLPVTEVLDSHLADCPADLHPSELCHHMPMVDIDLQAVLLGSTTAGHHHLYVNHTVYWKDYKALLKAMAQVGLIEQGYCNVSIARGGTSLRAPWIRKGKESEDVVTAVNAFLAGDEPEQVAF